MQVRIEVISEVIFDVSRHVYKQPALCEQKYALDQRYQDQQSAITKQLEAGNSRGQVVHSITEHRWTCKLGYIHQQDTRDTDR